MKAEELTRQQVLAFVWRERRNLIRFLRWTEEMEGYRKQAQRAQRPL
ncbi:MULTISPECIES: hypothetical protein [Acidobacterium]|nr:MULTISPECIES: hypothetical protein [Acidobacterium]